MTDAQLGAVCPQCGSAANVHSIEELATLAKARLGMLQQAPAQQGWAGEPQQGPAPGWAAEPHSGRVRGSWRDPTSRLPGGVGDLSIGDDIADIALTAATRFIGRAIGRRVQRTVEEKVMPAITAQQAALLRQQIEIAERHPDVRACMTDQVIFLAGGSRVLPMGSVNLATLTLEQADGLVAQLQQG
jgi:hypothetical protein